KYVGQSENGLGGIWGDAANDMWAVGGNGMILHWNGAYWDPSISKLPTPTDYPRIIDTSGDRPENLWVLYNDGTVLHRNGQYWSFVRRVAEPQCSGVSGIWGVALDDYWVICKNGSQLHYQGFGVISMIGSATDLRDIWGSSANELWTVGSINGRSAVLHYDS